MADWEHSELFHDWVLDLKMPNGGIRGAITFRNRTPGEYQVWGTVESWVGNGDGCEYLMDAEYFDDPNEAMGTLTMKIVNLLNNLINKLVKA